MALSCLLTRWTLSSTPRAQKITFSLDGKALMLSFQTKGLYKPAVLAQRTRIASDRRREFVIGSNLDLTPRHN